MKIKRGKPKIKEVMTTCCWCGKRIGKNQEVLALGCKKRPGIDISKYEGATMPVTIATIGETIWAIVPIAESDARRDGKDFMFILCSDECGIELKETLGEEKEMGDILLSSDLNRL